MNVIARSVGPRTPKLIAGRNPAAETMLSVDALKVRYARLSRRLEESRVQLDRVQTARRAILIAEREPKTTEVTKADAAVRLAENNVAGWIDAVRVIRTQLSAIEGRQRSLTNASRRAEVAALDEARAAAIDEAAETFEGAIADAADAAAKLKQAFQAHGLDDELPVWAMMRPISLAAGRCLFPDVVFADGREHLGSPPDISVVAAVRRIQTDRLRAHAAQVRAGEITPKEPGRPAEPLVDELGPQAGTHASTVIASPTRTSSRARRLSTCAQARSR